MINQQEDSLDDVLRDDWFVVCAAQRVTAFVKTTKLLGQPVAIWREEGAPVAAPHPTSKERYRTMDRYGYTWVSLGEPKAPLFSLPEFDQPGRRLIDCGAFGVRTSGLRMIENFLDMGHFPYVHTEILGKEPHTEVKEYRVAVDDNDELWATDCVFWQPKAAAAASSGMDVHYTYRVMQPFSAILYKSSPARPDERDVIALFVQPLSGVESRAHLMMLLYDEAHNDTELIAFQQTIFGQDKPILENQLPARLPLGARAETPARADAASIAYRRWLQRRGVTFGTVTSA